MLNVQGPASRYCDGLTRRNFLKIGTFAFGATAFNLADIYRAEAAQGRATNSRKAVINVYLGGGPAHQDMWDIKTEAPREIRGEFQPIATRVPGIQIGETFPRLARIMDKCVVIRSITGSVDRHDAIQTMTGYTPGTLRSLGGHPSFGAAIAKIQGQVDASVPAFVGLARPTQHRPWSDSGQVGFLGPAYAPFKPDGDGLADMRLTGLSADRLGDRRKLLTSFDQMRRDIDSSGMYESVDSSQRRALDVLTSSRLLEALDLSRESVKVRERYGDGKPYNFQYDGAPTVNEQLLVARRLVEVGVRCVTLTFGRWDSHGQNFRLIRDHGGKLDQCLSALIEDLDVRGMLGDVTVVAWGEFGRTPRINGNAGRDHWPRVSCCFLAGGGMRVGQVVGATNRLGEYATSRPVHPGEVVSTIYHNMGIDVRRTQLIDPTGRPQFLIDQPALPELI